MKRRSVTLVLLWQEYRAEQADGYGYSRFCDLYGEWRKTHLGDDAPDAPGRGEAVRRLCRRHGAGVRSNDECGASRPHLRRRARSIQLHLRRGALVGGARRLDRRPRQRLHGDRRRAEGGGVRQSEGRGHQAVALRARHQSHLSGSGGALRLCGAAGAGAQAARQGQGGGRRPHRRALRPGAAAQPALLLARRAQRRDPASA